MHILMIYLIFSMLAVMWFDATTYRIPNWLVASLLVLYPLAVYFGHGAVHWKEGLVALAVVFGLGYLIFALKWMGAGDIKFITACALWVGLRHLTDFIFVMALIGGLFAVIVWALRKALPYIPHKSNPPRILKDNEPIPYGIAIALAFLFMMSKGLIPG